KVYQYIKTAYKGDNKININNSYFFKNLENVGLVWELLENGKVIEKGSINTLNIEPRTEKEISLPVKTRAKNVAEYFLNVYYNLKYGEPFLPAGYNIAAEQFAWSGSAKPLAIAAVKGKLSIEKESGKTLVKG